MPCLVTSTSDLAYIENLSWQWRWGVSYLRLVSLNELHLSSFDLRSYYSKQQEIVRQFKTCYIAHYRLRLAGDFVLMLAWGIFYLYVFNLIFGPFPVSSLWRRNQWLQWFIRNCNNTSSHYCIGKHSTVFRALLSSWSSMSPSYCRSFPPFLFMVEFITYVVGIVDL